MASLLLLPEDNAVVVRATDGAPLWAGLLWPGRKADGDTVRLPLASVVWPGRQSVAAPPSPARPPPSSPARALPPSPARAAATAERVRVLLRSAYAGPAFADAARVRARQVFPPTLEPPSAGALAALRHALVGAVLPATTWWDAAGGAGAWPPASCTVQLTGVSYDLFYAPLSDGGGGVDVDGRSGIVSGTGCSGDGSSGSVSGNVGVSSGHGSGNASGGNASRGNASGGNASDGNASGSDAHLSVSGSFSGIASVCDNTSGNSSGANANSNTTSGNASDNNASIAYSASNNFIGTNNVSAQLPSLAALFAQVGLRTIFEGSCHAPAAAVRPAAAAPAAHASAAVPATTPPARPPPVGGLAPQQALLRQLLAAALLQPQSLTRLGLRPPRGALLVGPPGTGKTLLARAVPASLGLPLVPVSGPELMSAVVGETEARIRALFDDAVAGRLCPPGPDGARAPGVVIFLDELDGLAPRRGGSSESGTGAGAGGGGGEVEARVVAALLTCMDGLEADDSSGPQHPQHSQQPPQPSGGAALPPPTAPPPAAAPRTRVFVLAATNRASAIDPALRRPGRFDREIAVPIPTAPERTSILRACLAGYPLARELAWAPPAPAPLPPLAPPQASLPDPLDELAGDMHGYVGADIAAVVREGALAAMRRCVAAAARVQQAGAAASAASARQHVAERAPVAEAAAAGLHDARAASSDDDDGSGGLAAAFGALGLDAAATGGDDAGGPRLRPLPAAAGLRLSTVAHDAPDAPAPLTPPPAASDVGNPRPEVALTRADLRAGLARVQPSAIREVAVEVPNVRWDDIGGQAGVKQRLKEAVEWPLTHPGAFARLGIRPPRGVLLYGPPGCSKTMMAKAMASQGRMNFLAVKGPELLSKYVGDSEKAVAELFARARAAAPAVVFFDELDSLAPARGSGGEAGGGGGGVSARVVSQLLTELDGITALRQVVVVAATNRPDIIDPALLRPGRIDRMLYVGLPDAAARARICQLQLARVPHEPGLAAAAAAAAAADEQRHGSEAAAGGALAALTAGYSGAEIVGLFRDAAVRAVSEWRDAPVEAAAAQPAGPLLGMRHLEAAAAHLPRQVTPAMLAFYARFVGGAGE